MSYPVGVPTDVCDLFEKIALQIADAGWQHSSAHFVLHRIRWFHNIERGNREFKVNNNWSSKLSYWFMTNHPELPDFFFTRERSAA